MKELGNDKTLVVVYSVPVLNAVKNTVNSGITNTNSKNIKNAYLIISKKVSLKLSFLLLIISSSFPVHNIILYTSNYLFTPIAKPEIKK